MTTRGIRTPRRRKAWAYTNDSIVYNTRPTYRGLLDQYESDAGAAPAGITIMRIVGRISCYQILANTADRYSCLAAGITVLTPNEKNLASGAAGIPLPMSGGQRESRWLWQGNLEPYVDSSLPIGVRPAHSAVVPASRWAIDLDITQQRKVQLAGSTLAFVVQDNLHGGVFTAVDNNVLSINLELATLLALP